MSNAETSEHYTLWESITLVIVFLLFLWFVDKWKNLVFLSPFCSQWTLADCFHFSCNLSYNSLTSFCSCLRSSSDMPKDYCYKAIKLVYFVLRTFFETVHFDLLQCVKEVMYSCNLEHIEEKEASKGLWSQIFNTIVEQSSKVCHSTSYCGGLVAEIKIFWKYVTINKRGRWSEEAECKTWTLTSPNEEERST